MGRKFVELGTEFYSHICVGTAMENGPFGDAFPIENGDIPLLY